MANDITDVYYSLLFMTFDKDFVSFQRFIIIFNFRKRGLMIMKKIFISVFFMLFIFMNDQAYSFFDLQSALKEMSETEIAQYLSIESGYDYDLLKEKYRSDAEINIFLLKIDRQGYKDIVFRNFNEKSMGPIERGLVRRGHGIASAAYGMVAMGGNLLEKAKAETEGQALQDWAMKGYKDHQHSAYLQPKYKFSENPGSWFLTTLGEQMLTLAALIIGLFFWRIFRIGKLRREHRINAQKV